ncbi:MAG: hypothetical protein ACREBJ_04680 [Nitrosotalea sp.]
MFQICKRDISKTVKIILTYCVLSAAFSLVGIFLAEKGPLGNNPLGGLTLHEIIGHILFGLVAGTVTLSLRYTIIAGVFAVLIDSDHLISLTHIEALGRMSHSISFGVIAFVVMMTLFGKKDWRLGAIAFASVFSHISFDIFAGDPKFPIFAPFYNHLISFPKLDWLYFEIMAIIIIGIATIFTREKEQKITI